MPAKTATRAEAREIEGHPAIPSLTRIFDQGGPIENTEHHFLLQWVADRIVVRNQNGRRSDKMCLLCKEARRRREPCRHTRIWELAGVKPQHA